MAPVRIIRIIATGCIAFMVGTMTGCAGGTVLGHLMEARRLSAELLVEFTKTADAANRAVMAETEDESGVFARESEQLAMEVQRNSDRLAMILTDVGYSPEVRVLQEFDSRFAEYHALDRIILGLALENTNLKAQRLSFGPVQREADAFRDALDAIVRSAPPADAWRVKALVAAAMSAVREVQVLQAPHIAEADEAAMTRIEQRMGTAAGTARSALTMLASVVQPSARPALAAATSAFDRFTVLNSEVMSLSRRNSNVRSLALSLGKKRMLTASCEESLRALQGALEKRTFAGTR